MAVSDRLEICVEDRAPSWAGDRAATEAAFARAAHVVRLETAINRVTGVPMELRAVVGVYDPRAPRYTVYTSAGGGVVRQRDDIATVLGVRSAAHRAAEMHTTLPCYRLCWRRRLAVGAS